MQGRESSTAVDLKEELTRVPKPPAQTLKSNGRIVEYTSVRRRLTPSIARQQETQWLINTYEDAAEVLHRVKNGQAQVGPATLARVKKMYAVTRAELVRRGATKEELDYVPEVLTPTAAAELHKEAAAA